MKDLFDAVRDSSKPFNESAKLFLKSENKFVKAAGNIFSQYLDDTIVYEDEAINLLNRLDVLESPTSQHSFFFYIMKGTLETIDGKVSDGKSSVKKAKKYLNKSKPKHIKTWCKVADCHLLDLQEKYQEFPKLIQELNVQNNFDYYFWSQIANELAGWGLLNLNLNSKGIKYLFKEKKVVIDGLLFRNEVNKGQVAEANKYLRELPVEKFSAMITLDIDYLSILNNDLTGGKLEKSKLNIKEVYIKNNNFYRALLRKDAEGALQLAKEIVRLSPSEHVWPKMILADAEIVNANVEAAAYLVDQSVNFMSCVDYLMLARIEYHRGNIKKCAEYFQYSMEESIRNDMLPRFEFILKCAFDLGPLDIFTIMRALKKRKQSEGLLRVAELSTKTSKKKNLTGVACYIGTSQSSIEIKEVILQYAKIDMPVLLSGETGVGKEVVAAAIHAESTNCNEPYLPINCGAIVGNLLQSELFGHVAGSFTSAQKKHTGIFEAAGKGTVFLDEFGEMSHETQVALLRVLDTKQIRPIGSSHAKKIYCRILAATNAKLYELVKAKKFRSDLYYRLKSLEIKIKPLRERRDDILTLTLYFLNEERSDGLVCTLDASAKNTLMNYEWPGNIRELKNEIHKVRVLNSNKLHYSHKDFAYLKGNSKKEIIEFDQAPKATAGAMEPAYENVPDKIELVVNDDSASKRLKQIKDLFIEHKALRRVQIINTLKMAQGTATKDLRRLAADGFIKKVSPTKSARTHYFELVEIPPKSS